MSGSATRRQSANAMLTVLLCDRANLADGKR